MGVSLWKTLREMLHKLYKVTGRFIFLDMETADAGANLPLLFVILNKQIENISKVILYESFR